MIQGVAREQSWNSEISVGLGYIGVPFGVDRNKFVKSCYRREKVHVILDQGGTMVKNCYIDSNVLQRIKFPSTSKELGSQIVFVRERFNAIPFVIATVTRTRERVVSDEESFSIQRQINGGLLSIVGSGDGKLLINLENTTASSVVLNIGGDNSTLDVNNDGKTTINSSDDITINSSTKIVKNYLNQSGDIQSSITIDENGLLYEDDKGNKLTVDYTNNKIIHNTGSEPIPLGNTLQEELNNLKNKFDTFLNAFTSTPPAPGDGGATIQLAVESATASLSDPNFDNINSQKSFID